MGGIAKMEMVQYGFKILHYHNIVIIKINIVYTFSYYCTSVHQNLI